MLRSEICHIFLQTQIQKPHFFGVLLANVVSREGGSDVSFLRSVVATALTTFGCVEVVPATDDEHAEEDNYLVIASDGPIGLSGAIPYDADFLGEVLLDDVG